MPLCQHSTHPTRVGQGCRGILESKWNLRKYIGDWELTLWECCLILALTHTHTHTHTLRYLKQNEATKIQTVPCTCSRHHTSCVKGPYVSGAVQDTNKQTASSVNHSRPVSFSSSGCLSGYSRGWYLFSIAFQAPCKIEKRQKSSWIEKML